MSAGDAAPPDRPTGGSGARPRSARLLLPVVLGLLAAGGIGFGALSRPWASRRLMTPGLPPDTVTVAGSAAFPLAAALCLIVLTSALAVLATGPRVRRVVGVVVVLVAVAGVLTLAVDRSALASALSTAVGQSPAYAGGDPAGGRTGLTVWEAVTYASFALAVLLGGATVRTAPRWSTMSRRYEAPGAPLDPDDWWRAIDDGVDPTATGPLPPTTDESR